MRRGLECTAVVVLCCAMEVVAGEKQADSRLVEAQAAFDEATKLRDAGKYANAIKQGEHALLLREAVLGGTHPEVADCLNLLGGLHRRQGDFTHAEPLLERALSIRETALGKDHPDVASSLNDLATLYLFQGFYERAKPLLVRALAIREAALGKNHPDVASSLDNLARYYCLVDQPLYERAEPLLVRALSIREATLGKNHPDVAGLLNNLGQLYTLQGLFERAEPLLVRALAIREAALGKNHPDVAASLNTLAGLYWFQGLYGRIEPLLVRALSIQEAALGKNHLDVARSLDNLASLYATQGLYGRAEPLLVRALAISEAALGHNHPIVPGSLKHLALTRLAQGRLEDALPLFTRAFALSERRLRKEALAFSESRLTSFLQFLRDDEEYLYALLRAHPDDPRVQHLALSAVLLLKGRSVGETADISRTIYRSLAANDLDTFERLRGLRAQLATLSLAGPGKLAPAEYQQRLKSLIDEGDTLEADLAKRSAPLRALTALPPPDDVVDRVAASLPEGSALIEFIAYTHRPLVPKPGTPEAKVPTQLRYLALVLFPDARIRALDLGPAAPIDDAASRLRDALAGRNAGYQRAAQALHQLAFKPLAPLLGDVRRIFLAPDGQLGLVPFAALHDGHHFLVDTFDFTYLTSGKELLPRPEDTPPARSVVVFADPDFSASPVASVSSPAGAPKPAERSSSVERFFSTMRAGLANQLWVPLPGTRQEAETLQRLLPQAQLFIGTAATKEKLLHLETPGILHIATHGFFLEDTTAPTATRGVGHFDAPGGEGLAQRPPDPLLRSGLVLTGARAPAADAGEAGPRRLEDSLLTALELAGLNLWGTQLVVLSACDTGRGDVKLGQGVYGLRRAFAVAGAETLLMSLWKVNDETTRTLMESYYRNLLAGKPRAAALREAMLALREKEPHPYFWAPFIAIGKDAPLRGLTPPATMHTPGHPR